MRRVGSQRQVLPAHGPPIEGLLRGALEGHCRTLFGFRGLQGREGALLGSSVDRKGVLSQGSPACMIGGPGLLGPGVPCMPSVACTQEEIQSAGIDTCAEKGNLDLGVGNSAEVDAHFLELLHRCQELLFEVCWAPGWMKGATEDGDS